MLPDNHVDNLIPQQAPFVMISELLAVDERSARTRLHISAGNVLVDKGRFTEAGLVENMAQTAAARAGYQAKASGTPVQVGYISAVKNLQVTRLPEAGQELITEIEITDTVFNTMLLTGKVWCNGDLIAGCEMSVFLQSTEDNE